MMRRVAVAAAMMGLMAGQAASQQPQPMPTTQQVLDALVNAGQIADQTGGDFGRLVQQRLPDGLIQPAWQGAEAGTAVLDADADVSAEIKLRVRQRAQTLVEWPAWESIAFFDVGDDQAVTAELRQIADAKPRHLVIFPGRAGRDTSITVTGTSGRSYLLYVQVDGDRSSDVPHALVRIAANRPAHLRAGVALPTSQPEPMPALPKDWLESLDFDPKSLDFAYTMAGERTIAPQIVFTDGAFTYLYFGDSFTGMDLPVVSRVVDQIDTPVNTRVQGKTVIVESLVGEGLTLRLGQMHVCIRSENPPVRKAAAQQTPLKGQG